MPAQPTNVNDALSRIVGDLAQASTLPDADPQFFSQLQGVIVGYMRQRMGGGQSQPGGGAQAMGGGPQGMPSPGGPPPMPMGAGAVPGSPPGGPGGGPMMAGQPSPNGVTPLAQMPNPDELRRMLATQVGA